MEAATARAAPATRPAPKRRPGKRATPAKRRPRQSTARTRPRQAPAGRLIQHKTGRAAASLATRPRIMAGAALFPQAAMRSAGAVSDFSESKLIVRLTRGRGWIAVLCALLGGIVALNVLSLSLTAGSGRVSLQIDSLQTQNSALRAQIDERLSAVKVEAEAARLGLANPDPKGITFLSASDADARRVAHLLATDGFLLAPSQPSSYPAPGTSYAPTPTTAPPTTTTAAPTTTVTPAAAAPTGSAPTGAAPTSTGAAGGGPASSGTASGSTSSTTGGVGL